MAVDPYFLSLLQERNPSETGDPFLEEQPSGNQEQNSDPVTPQGDSANQDGDSSTSQQNDAGTLESTNQQTSMLDALPFNPLWLLLLLIIPFLWLLGRLRGGDNSSRNTPTRFREKVAPDFDSTQAGLNVPGAESIVSDGFGDTDGFDSFDADASRVTDDFSKESTANVADQFVPESDFAQSDEFGDFGFDDDEAPASEIVVDSAISELAEPVAVTPGDDEDEYEFEFSKEDMNLESKLNFDLAEPVVAANSDTNDKEQQTDVDDFDLDSEDEFDFDNVPALEMDADEQTEPVAVGIQPVQSESTDSFTDLDSAFSSENENEPTADLATDLGVAAAVSAAGGAALAVTNTVADGGESLPDAFDDGELTGVVEPLDDDDEFDFVDDDEFELSSEHVLPAGTPDVIDGQVIAQPDEVALPDIKMQDDTFRLPETSLVSADEQANVMQTISEHVGPEPIVQAEEPSIPVAEEIEELDLNDDSFDLEDVPEKETVAVDEMVETDLSSGAGADNEFQIDDDDFDLDDIPVAEQVDDVVAETVPESIDDDELELDEIEDDDLLDDVPIAEQTNLTEATDEPVDANVSADDSDVGFDLDDDEDDKDSHHYSPTITEVKPASELSKLETDEPTSDLPLGTAATAGIGIVAGAAAMMASGTDEAHSDAKSDDSAANAHLIEELEQLRAEKIAWQENKISLDQEIQSLKANPDTSHLDAELDKFREELAVVRSEKEQLQESLEEADAQSHQVSDLSAKLEAAENELERVRLEVPEDVASQWQTKFENLENDLTQQQEQSESIFNELADVRKKMKNQSENGIDPATAGGIAKRLEEKRKKLALVKAKLREKLILISEMKSEMEATNDELQNLKDSVDDSDKLAKENDSLHDEIADLKIQLEQSAANLKVEKQKSETASELQDQLSALQSENTALQQTSTDVDTVRSELLVVRDELSASVEMNRTIEKARDNLKTELEAMTSSNEKLKSDLELQTAAAKDTAALDQVREDVKSLEQQLAQARNESEQLKNDLDSKSKAVEQTEKAVNELKNFKQQTEQLQQANESLKNELDQTKTASADELAKAVEQSESSVNELKTFKQQTEQLQQANESLKKELDQTKTASADELAKAHAKASQMVDPVEVERLNSQIDQLTKAKLDLSSDVSRQQEKVSSTENMLQVANQELDGLKKQVSTFETENSEMSKVVKELKDQIAKGSDEAQSANQLRLQVKEQTSEIDRLKKELVEQKQAVADAQIAIQKAKTTRKSSSTKSGHDNLTLIKGLGKVMQKKLNAEGVNRFQQIKNWTAQDIARISDKLSLKDRVAKEDWVKQAAELSKNGDS